MGVSIPSSDFVAICLLMVDLNLDASIAEVIDREQAYEESQGCAFGVGAGDFRNAFYVLVLRGDIECSLQALPDLLASTPLRRWIALILRLNEFYTKDTEDWWTEDGNFKTGSEYHCVAYNAPFRAFFATPDTVTVDDVRAFFAVRGIGMDELMRHFR
jgi:hypothetical protein